MSKVVKRKAPIDVILDEQVIYGGMLMTRREVKAEMEAEGHEPRCIDFFVFGSKKVKIDASEQVA